MAERFDRAFDVFMRHECRPSDFVNGVLKPVGGGYVDIPEDRGGPTVYGISSLFLAQNKIPPWELGIPDFSRESLKKVTVEAARYIYYKYIWLAYKADKIVDETLAIKYCDISINCGPYRGALVLQQAVNFLNPDALKEDGKIGPKTIVAANACDGQALVNEICTIQAHRYHEIVHNNPSQVKFLKGWLKRASWGKR